LSLAGKSTMTSEADRKSLISINVSYNFEPTPAPLLDEQAQSATAIADADLGHDVLQLLGSILEPAVQLMPIASPIRRIGRSAKVHDMTFAVPVDQVMDAF
jgi:hypothetical protein